MGFDMGSFDMGSFAGSAASSLIGAAGSVIGAGLSYSKQKKLAEQQYKHQKEFARNGIQWKTQDAIKAGLHPLYAIGASGASYTPSGITDGGIGDALSQFGQNMGRAVEAGMTGEQRKALEQEQLDLQRRQAEANIDRTKAETAVAKNQALDISRRWFIDSLRAVNTPNNPPPQGVVKVSTLSYRPQHKSHGVTPKSKLEVRPSPAQANGGQFGVGGFAPDMEVVQTAGGGYAPVMSQAFAQSSEDDPFAKISWHIRNTLGNRLYGMPDLPDHYPKPSWAPKGSKMKYNWMLNEWRPYHNGDWISHQGKTRNSLFW